MILAVDQGTTGTTCLVVDGELQVLGRAHRPVNRSFPRPGWVEQNPDELVASVHEAATAALADAAVPASALDCVGIANQRETALVWERRTGRAAHPAIVWQDRRTTARSQQLPARLIRERTGLVPDPYFTATKLEWILNRLGGTRAGYACGTVDSWLVWSLTGGAAHVTDVSNASRTLLFDIRARDYDAELLDLFGIDRELLADVVPSAGVVGEGRLAGRLLPIAAIVGDQQAALVGQACFERGETKATFGTGAFLLSHAGTNADPPPHGLLLTVAAQSGPGPGEYALEGSILAAGAVIDWLVSGLRLLESAAESEHLARSIESTEGVHVVPALAGLGSPYWEPSARGTVSGLTQGTTRAHIARAALEAVGYRTRDILERIPFALTGLRVDGGVTRNAFAMQFLADLIGLPVDVAAERESTALGAAVLAGVATGVFESTAWVSERWRSQLRYEPSLSRDEADDLYAGWTRAVERTLSSPATG